mgnify:CR=1 FL=1
MVHNWVDNNYILIDAAPQFGQIDIGCFMAKTELAKKQRLNVKENWADWYFVKEYLAKNNNKKIRKIKKILYVHN